MELDDLTLRPVKTDSGRFLKVDISPEIPRNMADVNDWCQQQPEDGDTYTDWMVTAKILMRSWLAGFIKHEQLKVYWIHLARAMVLDAADVKLALV